MVTLLLAAALAVAGGLAAAAAGEERGRRLAPAALVGATALAFLGPTATAASALAAVAAYRLWIGRRAEKRRRAERDALCDHLQAVVSRQRGGQALIDALTASSCDWIRGAAARCRPGLGPGAALRAAAAARGLPEDDLGWTFTLDDLLAREIPSGAFLAAVAERLAGRRTARGRLEAATAQVRGQATVLALMPPALAGLFFLIDPVGMARGLRTLPGLLTIALVVFLEWLARRIVRGLLERAP